MVEGFAAIVDPWSILVPQLVANGLQSQIQSMEDRDRTGLTLAADSFEGNADGQIGEAIAIEIAGAKRAAEPIANLRPVDHGGQTLVEHLVIAAADTHA